MMATADTNLPLTVGATIAASLGRGLIWCGARFVADPVSSCVLVAMTLGTAFASTNALFMQVDPHPSPFFAEQHMIASPIVAPKIEPLVVLPTPQKVSAPLIPKVTLAPPAPKKLPIVAPVPAIHIEVAKIDHKSVTALQEKLIELKFSTSNADGFYGPDTASAIRAYEESVGLTPVGALTPKIIQAILSAKIAVNSPSAAPVRTRPIVTPRPVAIVKPPALIAKPAASPAIVPSSQPVSVKPADPLVKIVQRVATAAQEGVKSRGPTEDAKMIESVQRGLSSLGFLRDKIDGIAGASTAKAVRNFEVYYNYKVTGAVTPELIDMLAEAGARIE